MELCGFDSEYYGTVSPWCGLFDSQEWKNLEYYFDLDKYYGNGYGNPLGPVQGVGYVNELLSRLTGNITYANMDMTQVNHTLDRCERARRPKQKWPPGGGGELISSFPPDLLLSAATH